MAGEARPGRVAHFKVALYDLYKNSLEN